MFLRAADYIKDMLKLYLYIQKIMPYHLVYNLIYVERKKKKKKRYSPPPCLFDIFKKEKNGILSL